MISTGFLPSKHGFPFANCFPSGTPVFSLGKFGIGDISRGLCGGMVYLALDCFLNHQVVPNEFSNEVRDKLRWRLLESFDLPFGYFRYYEGQWRPDRSLSIAGVPFVEGIAQRTLAVEWPKVKTLLDAGSPVPLGLVQVKSFNPNPWILGLNHQVLAYGYEWVAPLNEVRIHIYDPNYPNDDAVSLLLRFNAIELDAVVSHSVTGSNVRGFFKTEYHRQL